MSPVLEKALSEMEKGAEEWLEVLRSKKKQVEEGETSAETVPKLISHIEKVEQEQFKEQPEGDRPVAEKEVSGGLTADREVAAAGKIRGEQATSENVEQFHKMAKPTDKMKWQNPQTKTIRQLEVQEGNQGQLPLSAGWKMNVIEQRSKSKNASGERWQTNN